MRAYVPVAGKINVIKTGMICFTPVITPGVPEATRQSMPPVSIPRHCLELMCACFAQVITCRIVSMSN